jgi:phenylacetate-CoA ligase
MIACGYDRRSLKQQTTSGSTGEPVTILRDNGADIMASAAGLRFRRWAGHDLGERHAQIWGRSLDPAEITSPGNSLRSRLKWMLSRFDEPVAFLNPYDMTETRMKEFAHAIETEKITVLVGYVNILYFFAQSMRSWKIDLKLKSVRTTAEVLHAHQRQLIEEVFGCKVFDGYGNRENGFIAAECDHHSGLHVNAENIYVEILDPSGNPVQGDARGEIVVTDLNNYAMPLIRYLTGDRGYFLREPCRCGRGLPLIGEIGGRVIDMIALSDGNFVDGRVLGRALWAFPDDIDRFTVVQHKRGEAKLLLKPARPIPDERLKSIISRLCDFTRDKLAIEVTIVDDLPIDPVSGKYRFVVSDVRPGADSDEP